MFEESLVESTPLLRTHNRLPALASIGAQAAVIAILLAIPLLHPEALVLIPNRLTTLAPPALRQVPPPPPPPPMMHVETSMSSTPSLAPATRPAQLLRQALMTDAATVDAPSLSLGLPGTPGPNPFSLASGGSPNPPHIVVGTPAGGGDAHGFIRLSTGVTAGMLLSPITPVYPPIARISHTEGVVVVEAIISKTGRIESAHAVSGPALLQAAAVAAVQQARYRPYLLNGLPTEVETTVTINFRVGS